MPKDGIEVPYDVIDKIILAEHQKQALSYSIYIINTHVIGQGASILVYQQIQLDKGFNEEGVWDLPLDWRGEIRLG